MCICVGVSVRQRVNGHVWQCEGMSGCYNNVRVQIIFLKFHHYCIYTNNIIARKLASRYWNG